MRKSLLLLAALSLLALPAKASIDGSYVDLLGPGTAYPLDTVTFHFYAWNGSADGEWIAEVGFRFHDLFVVQSGWYDDLGQGWSFESEIFGTYAERIRFYNDPPVGVIEPGTGGYFYVEVWIEGNADCGEYDIEWKLVGDQSGDIPHWLNGYHEFILCNVPVDESSWSTIKALY
jgi:hypothetical protein